MLLADKSPRVAKTLVFHVIFFFGSPLVSEFVFLCFFFPIGWGFD